MRKRGIYIASILLVIALIAISIGLGIVGTNSKLGLLKVAHLGLVTPTVGGVGLEKLAELKSLNLDTLDWHVEVLGGAVNVLTLGTDVLLNTLERGLHVS